jgi:hypothetical protein
MNDHKLAEKDAEIFGSGFIVQGIGRVHPTRVTIIKPKKVADERYKFMMYYNRGTESAPIWEVYGVIAPSYNKLVFSSAKKDEARDYAFSCSLPVVHGRTAMEKLLQDLGY